MSIIDIEEEITLFCSSAPIRVVEEENITQKELFEWAAWVPGPEVKLFEWEAVVSAAIYHMRGVYDEPIAIRKGNRGKIIWEHGQKKNVEYWD